jgi:hypothetical protein
MTYEQFSQLAVILADLCNQLRFEGAEEEYSVSDVRLETRAYHSTLNYTVSITHWQDTDLSVAYGCGTSEEQAFQAAISYIKRELAEKV